MNTLSFSWKTLHLLAWHEGNLLVARAKGKLREKQPKMSEKQQKYLCRMRETGQYSISDLAELFAVSRPTVYRTLSRHKQDE